jgi:hypothetical protein
MQYMILLYGNEAAHLNTPPEQFPAIMEKWNAYTQGMKDAGVFVAGDELKPTTTATSVRFNGGKVITTDGPFAETKEQLGGYYLIEVADLDAAIKWAGQCPIVYGGGCVELRAVMNHNAPPSAQ